MFGEQRKWNIGLMFFMIMLLILLAQVSTKLALNLALGIAIGFTLQKSRFCFVAGMRDPLLLGITSLSQALILLVALSILGYAWVIVSNPAESLFLNVYPLGIHTLLGGILFGIGMVIAGGCASGILMRMGEGFAMQTVAFIGLLAGAMLGGSSQKYWRSLWGESPGVFLPDKLGWIPALLIESAILFLLWMLARWWQNIKYGK